MLLGRSVESNHQCILDSSGFSNSGGRAKYDPSAVDGGDSSDAVADADGFTDSYFEAPPNMRRPMLEQRTA